MDKEMSEMTEGTALLIIGLLIAIGVGAAASMKWMQSRSDEILDEWCSQNGFALLSSKRRNFKRGPYSWTTGKGQVVFYVTVRDAEGETRSGYVRCGSRMGGLMSDKVTVEWD